MMNYYLPMRGKQASFLPSLPKEFGGTLARKGKRKEARPIDTKRPLHIVLRSSQAKGPWSMLKPAHQIEALVKKTAKKHEIRLYRFANVGNHLHLLILAPNRRLFKAFLRELPGAISMRITGARKGAKAKAKFWDYLPYTRIASWGRDFRNLDLYFVKNLFEGAGLLTKKAKAQGLKVIPLMGWAARQVHAPPPDARPGPIPAA